MTTNTVSLETIADWTRPLNMGSPVTKKSSPPKVDPDSYNSLVRAAKLVTIQLVESSFKVIPEYFSKASTQNKKRGFHCDLENITIDLEKGVFWTNFVWRTYVKDGRKTLFKLDCDYLCAYAAEELVPGSVAALEKRNVDLFLERIGKVATYPYFRAMASQYSWAANADLPMLPVLKSFPVSPPKKA